MRKPISDLAQVRSGYQFREKVEPDPNGEVSVIQIKDLTPDFCLSMDNLIRVSPPRSAPYRVQQGDVLFLARGHRLGAVAIPEPVVDTIATGFFFILRPSPLVRPGYLAWALNKAPFQSRMRPNVRGSHIPLITLGDFEKLEIDLPPLDLQEKIESLAALHRREMELSKAIESKRTHLIESICRMTARRSSPNPLKKG